MDSELVFLGSSFHSRTRLHSSSSSDSSGHCRGSRCAAGSARLFEPFSRQQRRIAPSYLEPSSPITLAQLNQGCRHFTGRGSRDNQSIFLFRCSRRAGDHSRPPSPSRARSCGGNSWPASSRSPGRRPSGPRATRVGGRYPSTPQPRRRDPPKSHCNGASQRIVRPQRRVCSLTGRYGTHLNAPQ